MLSSPKDLGAPRDQFRVVCEIAKSRARRASLLHFFMSGVLTAAVAKLLELQPLGRRFTIFGRRIIALFAITAL
jgi:hypothetical protein